MNFISTHVDEEEERRRRKLNENGNHRIGKERERNVISRTYYRTNYNLSAA